MKRFVYTSTVGAMAGDVLEDGRTYSEHDWPDNLDDLTPYIKAKVFTEKYLWDFVKERLDKQEPIFEVSVINPGFVLVRIVTKLKYIFFSLIDPNTI